MSTLQAMGKDHPDVRVNHIVAVLAMRGDLNRGLVQKVRNHTLFPQVLLDFANYVPLVVITTAHAADRVKGTAAR